MIDEKELLKQCRVTFGRDSGPGGQHRNKVETAVRIVHEPTKIEASAGRRRQQHINRSEAIKQLRLKLAVKHRRPVHRDRYQPSELWQSRRQGRQISVNPNHRDYPALLAEAMDLVVARGYDVAGAAGVLGVSMSQLAKLIRHNKNAFAVVNEGRAERGLPALK